jgi:hypothetical protein
MLKVNGEYLDFNGDIEIEKKIKLFEDIDTADGDLSFAFDINLTSNNLRILGIPVPDSISKIIYQNIDCVVQNDSGVTINNGSLRVERITGYVASCAFLGGNSNWFAMLDGNMTELRLSQYDTDLNEATITGSWLDDSGIVFPMLDLGALVTRKYNNAKTEDFVGCFFLHTLFKELFQQHSIKIEGELLNDSLFNQIVIATNTRSINDVNNNTVNVATHTPQPVNPLSTAFVHYDQTTSPYSLGSDVVVVSDRDFYSSAKMVVEVKITIVSDINYFIAAPLVNGAAANFIGLGTNSSNIAAHLWSATYLILIEDGDYISIQVTNTFGVITSIVEATLQITPFFIYKAFGASCVPLWTKQQFVSNVMKAFNVITSYNQFTKTVTFNLFDKLKNHQSIDVSDYIKVDTVDFSEFISNYGQVNNFSYQEGSDEDLGDYNISSFVKYAAGEILADNDFIEKSVDVMDLDFTTPISYVHPYFNGSLERINFIELETLEDYEITSVTDASGTPRFHITNANTFFEQNDLIRLDTDDEQYNGDFVVVNTTSTYLTVRGPIYSGTATGTATGLQHKVTNNDDIYWFINVPYKSSLDIFNTEFTYLNQSAYDSWSIGFFSLIGIGNEIENLYKQGLTFGEINSPTFFQKTLIDKYWQQFSRILNDPVKLITTVNLPWKVYNSIDFLNPVSITTLETSNLYYVNRIVGYKDSSIGCEVDLIKLP